MKERVKEFFLSNWSASEKCLLLTDVLLFGILVGWLTSPLKNGARLFSNNRWDICNTGAKETVDEQDS